MMRRDWQSTLTAIYDEIVAPTPTWRQASFPQPRDPATSLGSNASQLTPARQVVLSKYVSTWAPPIGATDGPDKEVV